MFDDNIKAKLKTIAKDCQQRQLLYIVVDMDIKMQPVDNADLPPDLAEMLEMMGTKATKGIVELKEMATIANDLELDAYMSSLVTNSGICVSATGHGRIVPHYRKMIEDAIIYAEEHKN